MNPRRRNNLEPQLAPEYAMTSDYGAGAGFSYFFKRGDDPLSSNPGALASLKPYRFDEPFFTWDEPCGHFFYKLYGTVVFDFLYVELNEPTPTPDIPSMDIISCPLIHKPALNSTVLLEKSRVHDSPDYACSLPAVPDNAFITNTTYDAASVWGGRVSTPPQAIFLL